MAPVSITSDTFSLSEIKSRDFLKTKILLTLLQLHQVPEKKVHFSLVSGHLILKSDIHSIS